MDDSTPPPTLENHHDAIFGNKPKRIVGIYADIDEIKARLGVIEGTLETADEVKQALENTAKGRGQAVAFVGKVVTWAATITGLLSGLYVFASYIRGQ